METEKLTGKLNSVIRGERAAAETYKQALDKVGNDPRSKRLRSIYTDHLSAVMELKKHVRARFDEPVDSSGIWGAFAKTFMGTAKLFGDHSTLKALKEGEEHGLKQYEGLLEDDDIDAGVNLLVKNTLIPKQREHLRQLDVMMQSH